MQTYLTASIAGATFALCAGAAMAETATVNGAELYYETIGQGPAILMMHGGLGLSHDYFRPWFDQLADTHTVVYYDHFGNGRSATPGDYAEMSFDRLASDGAALMDALGHDRFTLIGHSYGGFIAQVFATQYADRLDGLVLMNTVPAFDYAPALSGTEPQMQALGRLFGGPMQDTEDFRATWGQVVQMYFHEWDDAVGADLDARTLYNHAAWNAAGPMLGSFNMLEALPGVEVPTLVLSGAHDGITPAGPGGERIAGLLPNAELTVFANSAHYPFIEESEPFFARLTAWLAR